nr:MAG TPA: hypothetical protein [Siphoviridae sp. ct8LQ5]
MAPPWGPKARPTALRLFCAGPKTESIPGGAWNVHEVHEAEGQALDRGRAGVRQKRVPGARTCGYREETQEVALGRVRPHQAHEGERRDRDRRVRGRVRGRRSLGSSRGRPGRPPGHAREAPVGAADHRAPTLRRRAQPGGPARQGVPRDARADRTDRGGWGGRWRRCHHQRRLGPAGRPRLSRGSASSSPTRGPSARSRSSSPRRWATTSCRGRSSSPTISAPWTPTENGSTRASASPSRASRASPSTSSCGSRSWPRSPATRCSGLSTTTPRPWIWSTASGRSSGAAPAIRRRASRAGASSW